MINCLIVDDEQHSIDVLAHHVHQTDFLNLVGTATEATQALNMLNSNKIDLLFQDIHMPDISGIDLIKTLNGKCDVILTTAYRDYALEGYELGVVDYLLKPISFTRFIKAVQKVLQKQAPPELATKAAEKKEHDFIYVKTGIKNNLIKITFTEIEYIESVKNYAAIHHGGQKTLVYVSLKELEGSLPSDQFIRVHKSYIIPVGRIIRIEGNHIFLKDIKADIILGETYRSAFWQIVKNKTLG
jgi:two-component system LytT family response regulator